jgi:hypothetical protein
MKSPPDKTIAYTAVVVVISFFVFAIGFTVVGAVTAIGAMGGAMASSQNDHLSGVVHFNGQSVDLGKLQAAAQQAEDAAKQAQGAAPDGKVAAIDPEKLKTLLPDSVAGAPRTEISATSAGAGGYGGSNAEATYEAGDKHVTVTVTDLAAAGALAAMAGAVNMQHDEETATGYEKVSTINGRLTTEKYDNQSKSGEYSVIVANRFNVSAEGSGVSIDDLKGAVAAIGPDRLDALSHG